MTIRTRGLVLPLLSMLLAAAGCASAHGTMPMAPAPAERLGMDLPTPHDGGPRARGQARELVRQVRLELVAERPVALEPRVRQVVEGTGGYVEHTRANEGDRLHMVLRVPAASLDAVLAELGTLGEVADRQVTSHDVTEQSADLDARLRNLVAVRDRLRQHLQAAANVQEIMAVERELTQVQTEIERLESARERLRAQVAMARVELNVRQRRVLGPLGLLVAGTGWLIGKLFVIR